MNLAVQIAEFALIVSAIAALVLITIAFLRVGAAISGDWSSRVSPRLLAGLNEIFQVLTSVHQSTIQCQQQTLETQKIAIDTLTAVAQLSNQSWAAVNRGLDRVDKLSLEATESAERFREKIASSLSELNHLTVKLETKAMDFEKVRDSLASIDLNTGFNEIKGLVNTAYEKQAMSMASAIAQIGRLLNLAKYRLISAYPRSIRLEFQEGKMSTSVPEFERTGIFNIPGQAKEIHFRILCESPVCNHKENGVSSRYVSTTLYRLDKPSYWLASFFPSGTVEKIADLAEITELSEVAKTGLEGLVKAGASLLRVKVVLGLAHPVAIITYVAVKEGIGEILERMRRESERKRATEDLWRILSKNQFDVLEVGGLAHTQLGKFIGSDEHEKYIPNGGLTQILDGDGVYRWVCQSDAQLFVDSLNDGT